MKNTNQDFFEVVDIESEKKHTFETAREVSFFLSGLQYVFFKIFKNGKEVSVSGVNLKNLKSYLQAV